MLLGGERFCFILQLTIHHEGKLRRKSKQKPGSRTGAEPPRSVTSGFLVLHYYTLRDIRPDVARPTVG